MANKINQRELPSYPVRQNQREKKLYESVKKDKNVYEDFSSPLNFSSVDKNAGGILDYTAEPAAGQEYAFSSREAWELHIAQVESSTTAVWSFPKVSADGLEMVVDANATDGITAYEISNGILSSSKAAWTVGSDEFYLKATIKIDDISDVTEAWFGLRKAEAYQVDPENYDEMASFNIDTDGDINIGTILNNGATSVTDTTEQWADGEEKTLEISVREDGHVSFSLDGAAPSTTVSTFKFDSGEVLVPFFMIDTEAGDPGISISSWECGASKDNHQ